MWTTIGTTRAHVPTRLVILPPTAYKVRPGPPPPKQHMKHNQSRTTQHTDHRTCLNCDVSIEFLISASPQSFTLGNPLVGCRDKTLTRKLSLTTRQPRVWSKPLSCIFNYLDMELESLALPAHGKTEASFLKISTWSRLKALEINSSDYTNLIWRHSINFLNGDFLCDQIQRHENLHSNPNIPYISTLH